MLTGTQCIVMLPRHTKRISGHSKSLSGHTKRFNRHSRRLPRHGNKLLRHGNKLPRHVNMLTLLMLHRYGKCPQDQAESHTGHTGRLNTWYDTLKTW
jgi:hypothetical protein